MFAALNGYRKGGVVRARECSLHRVCGTLEGGVSNSPVLSQHNNAMVIPASRRTCRARANLNAIIFVAGRQIKTRVTCSEAGVSGWLVRLGFKEQPKNICASTFPRPDRDARRIETYLDILGSSNRTACKTWFC